MDHKAFVLGMTLGAVALGVTFATTVPRLATTNNIARNTYNQMEVSQADTMGDELAYIDDTSLLAAQFGDPTSPPISSSSSSSSSSPRYVCDHGQCVLCTAPGCPGQTLEQCRASCAVCGNGILEWPEQCDDGNNINGDGCSNECRLEGFSSSSVSSSAGSCNPTQAYDAEIVEVQVPLEMQRGSAYTARVVARNLGTETWTIAKAVRLGTVNPWNHHGWMTNRVDLKTSQGNNADVRSCETFNFEFVVVPLYLPGVHDFQWRMLRESISFFGKSSTNLKITVK